MRIRIKVGICLALLALTASVVGASPSDTTLQDFEDQLTGIVEKASESVVSVRTTFELAGVGYSGTVAPKTLDESLRRLAPGVVGYSGTVGPGAAVGPKVPSGGTSGAPGVAGGSTVSGGGISGAPGAAVPPSVAGGQPGAATTPTQPPTPAGTPGVTGGVGIGTPGTTDVFGNWLGLSVAQAEEIAHLLGLKPASEEGARFIHALLGALNRRPSPPLSGQAGVGAGGAAPSADSVKTEVGTAATTPIRIWADQLAVHGGKIEVGTVATGFIIDENGSVLTTTAPFPVGAVGTATSVEVILKDGQTWPMRVVGSDPRLGLALLRPAPGAAITRMPRPLPLGDSAAVRSGALAVVIANQAGLQGSVSLGVVAGVDRDCPWDPSLKGLIQITAGVAGGSSGAPVLNSKAQVVGVVTAMSDFRRSGSQTGGPQAFVNALVAAGNMTKEEADRYLRFMQVAAAPAGAATQPMPPAAGGNQAGTFAIPINLVKEVLGEMAEGGMVRRASLGAVVGGVARSVAGGPLAPEGALVMSVEQGGAAARAGIQVGDCIIRFGDAWVEDGAHLSQLVAQKRPGAVVSVWVVRGTELLKPSVTLGVEKGVALPAPGKIAFTSNRDGNLEIYVMNSDGSNETNLTNNSAWDSEPSWSPH